MGARRDDAGSGVALLRVGLGIFGFGVKSEVIFNGCRAVWKRICRC